MTDVAHRICPICEAGCGLKVRLDNNQVIAVASNQDDVFSEGHICAKGIALTELHADPDRIREPMAKSGDGHKTIGWDEAWEKINTELKHIREQYGDSSIAVYAGNPTAHNFGLGMGLGLLAGQLGTPQFYSAGSVDQLPKQLASELMFGNDMAIPVPDIQRADYFLMLGANPIVSNGSLWMVPGFRNKLRQFQARGGQLVTIDPRRNETAQLADKHHFIRPGTDAWLLSALINVIAESRALPQQYRVEGASELLAEVEKITPATAAAETGISEAEIRTIAADLLAADHPVVYGRVGTTLQSFGTLTSFLIEVINLMTGALDQPGGAMFPEQVYHSPQASYTGPAYNRYQTRVSGYPEVMGQFPVAALAEEIETPGDGQIKALVCFAGNPVVSNPDSERLAQALASLELLVCIDLYQSETSALADIILPGSSPFEDHHYDSFLGSMGYRNSARYSRAILPTDSPSEWATGLTLAYLAAHQQVPDDTALKEFEDNIVAAAVSRYCNDPNGPLHGKDVQTVMASLRGEDGMERLLDLGIRAGRWGDHFQIDSDGLNLQTLIDTPNGIDLGPPRANRLAEVTHRPDKVLQLGPEIILSEMNRLRQTQTKVSAENFLLIGRRRPHTNNSWLRNLAALGKSKHLCPLEINDEDAGRLGISDGDLVKVGANGTSLQVVALLSKDIASGVVALPHGFSQKKLQQRNQQAAPNYNVLASAGKVDVASATAALNGIEVSVSL